jgi:hypothetical protein
MRAALGLVLLALLTSSGGALATQVRQEVAGHVVEGYADERTTTHNEYHDATSDFVYHREASTSGAWVDGQGANLTLSDTERTSSYHSGSQRSDQHSRMGMAQLQGQAQGVTTDQQARATLIESGYDFGELEHANGTHLQTSSDSNTYGNPFQVQRGLDAAAGAGDLESDDLNNNPFLGVIAFATLGVLTDGSTRVFITSAGDQAGASTTAMAGDWTGSFTDAVVWTARCQGNDCQYLSQSIYGLCLVGYRPPFFVDCLPGL